MESTRFWCVTWGIDANQLNDIDIDIKPSMGLKWEAHGLKVDVKGPEWTNATLWSMLMGGGDELYGKWSDWFLLPCFNPSPDPFIVHPLDRIRFRWMTLDWMALDWMALDWMALDWMAFTSWWREVRLGNGHLSLNWISIGLDEIRMRFGCDFD